MAGPPAVEYTAGVSISSVNSSTLPDPVTSAQAGMRRGLSVFSTAAEAIAQGNLDPSNFVGMIEGQRTYEMNAKVVQSSDEMLGSLLDIKA